MLERLTPVLRIEGCSLYRSQASEVVGCFAALMLEPGRKYVDKYLVDTRLVAQSLEYNIRVD